MKLSDIPRITSLQNPLVKEVVRLQQKASVRNQTRSFVIEGVREIAQAIRSDVQINYLYVCLDFFRPDPHYPVDLGQLESRIRAVSPAVFEKMAYRGSAGGLLAVADCFNTSIERIQLSEKALVFVLEAIEKPGNLGAILRTADATGADAVVVCDPKTDVFNPNVIRSSLGCVFSVKTAVCDKNDYFQWASQQGITSYLASLQGSKYYFEADFRKSTALVFGTESEGLSAQWYSKVDQHLKIPMLGQADSLNLSASVAIMAYEVVKQRIIHAR